MKLALSLTQMSSLYEIIDANEFEPAATGLRTCVQLLANVEKDAVKYGELKAESRVLQTRLLRLTGSATLLDAIGFCPNTQPAAQASTFAWSAEGDAASCAAALHMVLGLIEGLRDSIVLVGDTNHPSAAKEAIKLVGTYVGNLALDPANESRRRIKGANKALQSRLLAVQGGTALLQACQFEAEPEGSSEPEFYVCAADASSIRLVMATLSKAESLWAAVAAKRGLGGEPDQEADGSHRGEEAASVAVIEITIAKLAPASSLGHTPPPSGADMQPALVRSSNGLAVELHCWQAASKRWTVAGMMAIPSTDFVYSRPNALVIDVDLGDGKPVELTCGISANGESENEYVAAQRFISEHFMLLNSAQHLEEIATKVRAKIEPVLATVSALKKAMEAQN